MVSYDSIIIGAGYNGLVCAAYLARGGQRVLVLEAAGAPGGLAAAREFHDGYRVPVAHAAGAFPAKIVRDLGLGRQGFAPGAEPFATTGLGPDGRAVVIGPDAVTGVPQGDAAAYGEFQRLLGRFADALEPFWLKTMPRIGPAGDVLTFARLGFELRRMGRKDFLEFLRVFSLPARDLLDEFFTDDTLKAALAWDGLAGGKMAPRSPNGAVLAMLYRRAGNPSGARRLHAGDIGKLTDALLGAATDAGAEIRCDARVEKLLFAGEGEHRVTGVALAGGETLEADRVVSSADPKTTFLELAGVASLDIGFTNRIRRLRSDGYVAKLHLALDGPPEFGGIERADGRLLLADSPDAIEFAFDDAKYGACPEDPVVEVTVPTLHDASLAPDGRHVLSAHVMYVPYRLKGGWTDERRDAMRDRAIERIARHAPGLREQVVAGEFLTPADLEREYRVTGGHWHHAELAIDQLLMMRPTYEAAQYATPLPGLWLCGAGCHPGGDLTGAAGHNAAQAILE